MADKTEETEEMTSDSVLSVTSCENVRLLGNGSDVAAVWGRAVLAFLDLTGRSFESLTVAELRKLSESFQFRTV